MSTVQHGDRASRWHFVLTFSFLLWYKQDISSSFHKEYEYSTCLQKIIAHNCLMNAMQSCIWKENKGCSDSATPVMSNFVRNNKWHWQFTALKSVYTMTLHLLFKHKYWRWSVVQDMFTGPRSRDTRLIKKIFWQFVVLKVFLCYTYFLIEITTLDHFILLDADWSMISKPSIFLLILQQLQFYGF